MRVVAALCLAAACSSHPATDDDSAAVVLSPSAAQDGSVFVTGLVTASKFSGDGSALTGLKWSQLTGTMPAPTLPSAAVLLSPSAAQDGSVFVTGLVTASKFSGDGSALTGLKWSQLTGTMPSPPLPADVVRAGQLATSVDASAVVVGSGANAATDSMPGALAFAGATDWRIEASEAPALEIIDWTNHIRRGIFDTVGNVYLGDTIGCVGGCSAGLSYRASDHSLTLRGPLSVHQGRVQPDALYYDAGTDAPTLAVHVKSSLKLSQGASFRLRAEGFNPAAHAGVESVCAGTAAASGLVDATCTDRDAGATAHVYASSDGFLVLRLDADSLAGAGFTLSASYFFAAEPGSQLDVTYAVVRSATDL